MFKQLDVFYTFFFLHLFKKKLLKIFLVNYREGGLKYVRLASWPVPPEASLILCEPL